MARFETPSSGGPMGVHVIGSDEYYIVSPESNGQMLVYNSNAGYSGLGIGDWYDGYQVPAGTTVTICTAVDGYCYLDPENSNVQIWGAGYNTSYSWWYLPSNTIATLVKVDDENTWMISGAGLAQD